MQYPGRPIVKIMCLGKVARLPANCCFRELARSKSGSACRSSTKHGSLIITQNVKLLSFSQSINLKLSSLILFWRFIFLRLPLFPGINYCYHSCRSISKSTLNNDLTRVNKPLCCIIRFICLLKNYIHITSIQTGSVSYSEGVHNMTNNLLTELEFVSYVEKLFNGLVNG